MGSGHSGKKEKDKQTNKASVTPNKYPNQKPQHQRIIKLKARFSFDSNNSDELSFSAGAIMYVLKDDGDWWYAKDVNNREGYIPKNYFVEMNTLEEFDWYHGNIERKDAEKLLQCEEAGTFLVRESQTISGFYSISVVSTDRTIKHYRIKKMDDGRFYVTSKNTFQDLNRFVEFCKVNLMLCCLLKKACKRINPGQTDLSRSMKDKWEIDRHLIELNEKFGAGNFGEVWKGMFNKRTVVAVKIMKPNSMQRESFLSEASIMKQLRHPKLVKLYGVCSDDPIYIVTEFMSNGCLQSYLRKDLGRTLKTNLLIDFGAQVASGMQYIEAKNYVHRDLAARNVLVGENNMLKIGDFGLTKMLSHDFHVLCSETKFPVRWTSPEVFTSKLYGIKSDVWAFGVLLVELFTYGDLPYPGMTNAEVQQKVLGTYRHPKPSNCSPEMYEVMLSCWHKDPEKRPTFECLFQNLDDFVVANELAYS